MESNKQVPEQAKEQLKKNLKFKGITVPVIFAIVVVIFCVIFSNLNIGFFPSGNHHDSLTTTIQKETTEFDENEFSKNA